MVSELYLTYTSLLKVKNETKSLSVVSNSLRSLDYSLPGSPVREILQEYWSGQLFCSPEDLPNTGIKFASPVFPALQADSFLFEPPGNPIIVYQVHLL